MNIDYSNLCDKSSNIIFVTGGTKSGKSEFAEYLAKKVDNLTYIALSEIRENDKNHLIAIEDLKIGS